MTLVRRVEDRPGHDRRYSVDCSKLARPGLGAARTRSTRRLRETVDWYREREDWWRPLKSGEYRDYYARQYGDRLRRGTAVE